MTDDPRDRPDPLIGRIADALRPLPVVDPAAVARVLVAVHADRSRGVRVALPRRRTAVRVAILGAVAAGVLVAASLRRSDAGSPERAATRIVSLAEHTPVPAVAAMDAGAAAPISVQLVVAAPDARRVAVVGDFTGWDAHRIAMTRDPASGLWVASVAVRAGRHVYAFVADDSVWMRDPRAPVVRDADFGRPGSLLLVGRP